MVLGAGAAAAASAAGGVAGVPQASAAVLEYEVAEANGLPRVRYNPDGYKFWNWRGKRCHYIDAGTEAAGRPPVVLVHGYGASAIHWRYQIPALEAAGYKVYALCLLGFGWSEKAVTDYSSGGLWADQLGDFVKEVVWSDCGANRPVVLAGNSLGGYASLVAAARYPDLVQGLVLLNSAGPLKDPAEDEAEAAAAAAAAAAGGEAAAAAPWWAPAADAVTNAVKRVVLFFAFQRARQPERIREVLGMVYVNQSSIDDDLVESIRVPATDPNAAEVFYRINASNSRGGAPPSVNALIRQLKARRLPTLLLWGARDPWITAERGRRMKALYPEAVLELIPDAGHCPHDDAPAETSAALLAWLGALKPLGA